MHFRFFLNKCLQPGGGRRQIASAILLVALGVSALHLVTNQSRADEDGDESETISVPSRVSVQGGLNVLTLDAAARENAGIETAPLKAASEPKETTAYATVFDAAQLTQLRNAYLSAKMQVETARAKLSVSRAAFERADSLHANLAVSLAALQTAHGNFGVDQAALGTAQSSLATAAANAQQTFGSALGKAIVDGAPLVEDLIARRTYLVKVTLPPGAIVPKPPTAMSARFGNGHKVQLDFISLGTATDPKIQGTSYFYRVAAESGLLPRMNGVVSLPGETIARGLLVPQSAVVWMEGKAWVYLRTGVNTFVRREIAAHTPAADGSYIVTDISPNARIVIRGGQMLLSEEFRAQVTAGGDQD